MNSKTFLVLVAFLLLIIVFIGGAIGDTDLTPPTIKVPGENKVVSLPNGPVTPQVIPGSGGLPLTGGGPCPSAYTVQRGDTLSKIARTCNLSLQDILSANPVITNPNLIRVGQQINIYYPLSTVVAATMVVAPTATTAPTQPPAPNATGAPAATSTPAPSATSAPTATVTLDNAALQMVSTASVISKSSGLRAGTSFDVIYRGLPANSPVALSFIRPDGFSLPAGEATTSAGGVLTATVTIPADAKPGEKWAVLIASKDPQGKVVPPVEFVIDR